MNLQNMSAERTTSIFDSVPKEVLDIILEYCNLVTLNVLVCAISSLWRREDVPHAFTVRRNVVDALNRIRFERLKSPWHYYPVDDINLAFGGTVQTWEEFAWNEMFGHSIQVPYASLLPSARIESIDLGIYDELFEACEDSMSVVFADQELPNGFFLLALHSDEMMFAKGYGHMTDTSHPPRGKLPKRRKWNYESIGYL